MSCTCTPPGHTLLCVFSREGTAVVATIEIKPESLTDAERRALTAMTRGSCGRVSDARVWCDADRTGDLMHTATFDRLVERGLAVYKGPRVGYRLTLNELTQVSK